MPLARWPLRLAWLLPALALAAVAVPRFLDGLAVNRAYPVPLYLATNVALPPAAYRDAAAALQTASPKDGEALIARADAALAAGARGLSPRALAAQAIGADPANAQGWTVLAEALSRTDRPQAAAALDMALVLAPYDYFLAGRRARDAAALWDSLPPASRDDALRQTRLLWTEQRLRPQLLALLETQAGADLVTRAFANDPDTLRALNRWVSAERRRQAEPG